MGVNEQNVVCDDALGCRKVIVIVGRPVKGICIVKYSIGVHPVLYILSFRSNFHIYSPVMQKWVIDGLLFPRSLSASMSITSESSSLKNKLRPWGAYPTVIM